jgi:N-acetylmuramic acid 6-phosphate (MurNAc-6-P) etherase
MEITGCTQEKAIEALEKSGRQPKLAVAMVLLGVDSVEASRLLEKAGGHIAGIPGLAS